MNEYKAKVKVEEQTAIKKTARERMIAEPVRIPSEEFVWKLLVNRKLGYRTTLKLNDSEFFQKIWVKKCLNDRTNVRNSNTWVDPNDGRDRPNIAKRLAESTRTALVSISPIWSSIKRVSDIFFFFFCKFFASIALILYITATLSLSHVS